MRRIIAILMILLLSCSPRFQEMRTLLEDPDNIIVPFDSTFLGFNVVMEHFAQQDARLVDTVPRIVFTGSSSIRLWDSLATDMDTFPYQVLNRGFGGSILPEINYFFDHLITVHQPEVVVLYCGENDIIDGYQAKNVLASFRTFLRLMLHNSPCTKVIYVSMKPSLARWKIWPEMAKGNRLIEQFIARLDNPDIHYLDISVPMLDPENGGLPRPELFSDDQLHMNREGYLIWRAAVAPALKKILPSV